MSEVDKLEAFTAGFEAGAAWDAADGHGEEPDALSVIMGYLMWSEQTIFRIIPETEYIELVKKAKGGS